jgi:hypothetical protein
MFYRKRDEKEQAHIVAKKLLTGYSVSTLL